MNKKGISKMILVAIIIVVVLVVGIATYLVMSGGGGGNGTSASPSPSQSPSPTASESPSPSASTSPSPSPSLSPSPTPSGNGNGGTDVAGASSLQFSVSFTEEGMGTYDVSTYKVKNAGTSNVMMRIDTTVDTDEDYIYILNGAQQKVWIYGDGEWADVSVAYDTYWSQWSTTWEGYRANLADWTGLGDWSYTDGGVTIRIYDIDVNPSLPDSLFQPD